LAFPETKKTKKLSCGEACACPRDQLPVLVPVPVGKRTSRNPPLNEG